MAVRAGAQGLGPEGGTMSREPRFFEEVLTPAQADVLAALGPELDRAGYVLAGGTATALLLGHRRSADLDWLGPGPLDEPLRLAGTLGSVAPPWVTDRVAPGTLHGRARGIRVSVIEYRYPMLAPPVLWSSKGCRLASLDDLCAMKLAAVAQRGSRKDFWDVYALALLHRPLREMLELYRDKFGIHDPAHVLYGLAYLDDADREPDPEILWDTTWKEVRQAVRRWVREIAG